MKTKTKAFDGVEMSRRLRENTSCLLHSMTREQRHECLREARERYAAEQVARQSKRTLETTSSS